VVCAVVAIRLIAMVLLCEAASLPGMCSSVGMIRSFRCVVVGLLAAGLCSVAHAQVSSGFDVTLIKPAKPDATGLDWDMTNNLTVIRNISVEELIRNAYGLKTRAQIVGGPEWIRKVKFDVTAKMSDAESRREKGLTGIEWDRAYGGQLQLLLKDRFGLQVTEETRKLPVYALVMGPPGTFKAEPTKPGVKGRQSHGGRGNLTCTGVTMDDLVEMLSGRYEVAERVVTNRTGLTGRYDFTLEWTPDNGGGIAPDATLPGLVDAVHEQLGLRLVKETGDLPVVVVVQARQPELD
jgi:uncharacterized protein (TIGR03435 family)